MFRREMRLFGPFCGLLCFAVCTTKLVILGTFTPLPSEMSQKLVEPRSLQRPEVIGINRKFCSGTLASKMPQPGERTAERSERQGLERKMEQSQDPEFIKQFHVLGTSHRRAPVEVRERLTVPVSDVGLRARQLTEQAGIEEAAIVSTCLRSEFYICGNDSDPRAAVAAFWSRCFGIEPAHFRPFLYCKSGRAAVSHLFRVVAGLDSLIVGENQAMQRASDALAASLEVGAAGAAIQKIFLAALQCGERVHTETRIGRREPSLGRAVVELVEKIFGSLENSTVLLIGGGQTCELAAKDLSKIAVERIWLASPDEQEAQQLAERLGHPEMALAWSDLRQAVSQADVVINIPAPAAGSAPASTSVATPVSGSSSDPFSERRVLQRSDYERIRPLRQRRPLFLLDLAVPRGIDPALNSCDEVFLYNVDDMAPIAAAEARRYAVEIQAAESLVRQEVEQFLRSFRADPPSGLPATLPGTLQALERQLECIRQEQLSKSRASLQSLTRAQQRDVERLTSAITRKIFREVEHELRSTATEKEASKVAETVSQMLGLV